MAKAILIPGQIMADNVDSLVKSAVCASEVENGMVGLLSETPASAEVFTLTANAAVTDTNMYMVNEPVMPVTDGKYKGLTDDPTVFSVAAGKVFTVYRPAVGDEIILSADAVTGTANNYAILNATALKMVWAAAAGTSSLVYKLIGATTINVPGATFYTAKTVAYKLRCIKA